jgi:hypothetical protein
MAATGRWCRAGLGLTALAVVLAFTSSAFAQGRDELALSSTAATTLVGPPRLLANGGHEDAAFAASFIKPLGITTITLLVATLIVGLTMKKKRRVLLPVHRTLAFITLALALSHGLLVLLSD